MFRMVTIYPDKLSCYEKMADSKINLLNKNVVILALDRVTKCQICYDDPKLLPIKNNKNRTVEGSGGNVGSFLLIKSSPLAL